MSFLMKFLLFCSYLTLALKAPTNATCLYSSNTCLLTAKPREEQISLISLLSFSSSTQTPHFHLSTFFKDTWCCHSLLRNRNILKQSNMNSPFSSKPGSHVRFWPWFGRLRQILKIQKDFYNPRLKSEVFDCWFDMFNDSRLMAKFDFRQNSGSQKIWRTVLQCDFSNDEHQTVFIFQDKLWAELMLDNYSISHKLRRSRPPLTEFIWYAALSI